MTPLDAGQLLTIDVGAEIRKVAEAQIESAWQLPAELVRLALRAGARDVEVSLRRSQVIVRQDGPGFAPPVLQVLADLLDEALPSAVRHRALLTLESHGALGLVALVGLGYSRLRIESGAGSLDHSRGRRPRCRRPPAPDTRIEIHGLRLGRERARAWLEAACRFAPVRIRLDGHDLPRGFPDALAEDTLKAPAAGKIALPRVGDVARVWLIRDGLLTAHLTVPDVPCFEAALEMSTGPGPVTAAALREAAAPHLDDLVNHSLDLALRLGRRLRDRDALDQRRVRHLLLKAARSRARLSEIFSLPLVPALVPPAAQVRLFSLFDLGRAAEAGPGRLPALYPDQDPGRHVLPGTAVFVLDAQERGALSQLLDLRFGPCAPRPASPSVRAQLAQGLAALGATTARVLHRLLHPREGPPVAEESLSAAERAFLAGLRDAVAGADNGAGSVKLGQGRGPVRRRGNRYWLFPRRNSIVRAGLRLVPRDPRWLYPVVLALFEGRALPKPETALAWRVRRASPTSGPGR